jgi:hypothetical protein
MTTVKIIIHCLKCRQKNRVVVGTKALCGKCKHPIVGMAATLDNLSDRLNAADASMAFGRMNSPQDYQVCGGCGCTFHIRDGADHDACNPVKS